MTKRLLLVLSGVMLLPLLSTPTLSDIRHYNAHGTWWALGCQDGECFMVYPIDITTESRNIGHVITDCSNSNECRALIAIAAAAVGADPQEADDALQNYGTIANMINGESIGNQHWVNVEAPPGMILCTIKWHVYALNGESTISGTVSHDRKRLMLYANVPEKGYFEGRNWLHALIGIHWRDMQNLGQGGCDPGLWATAEGLVVFDTNGVSVLSGTSPPPATLPLQ